MRMARPPRRAVYCFVACGKIAKGEDGRFGCGMPVMLLCPKNNPEMGISVIADCTSGAADLEIVLPFGTDFFQ